jgi:hypothetical protein
MLSLGSGIRVPQSELVTNTTKDESLVRLGSLLETLLDMDTKWWKTKLRKPPQM